MLIAFDNGRRAKIIEQNNTPMLTNEIKKENEEEKTTKRTPVTYRLSKI